MAMVEVTEVEILDLDAPSGDHDDKRDRFTRVRFAGADYDLTKAVDGLHEVRVTLSDNTQMWLYVHNNMIVGKERPKNGPVRLVLMGTLRPFERANTTTVKVEDFLATRAGWPDRPMSSGELDSRFPRVKRIEVSANTVVSDHD